MFQEFYRHSKRNNYWQKDQKILLAVSGGVDSMVLLTLMQQAAQKDHLQIAVAHVNHQLRQESAQEAAYLEEYCQKQGLPYYSKEWLASNKEQNTEARARAFRYDFFAEVMEKEAYSLLLTAHHNDDQAETILMKLTRGSALPNLVGIRGKQPFGKGELCRPFLIFSKEHLEQFANQSKIVYFEDCSNYEATYMRNRIRHQVVPVLKKENAQFLQHMNDFSMQIEYADDIIQSVIEPKYNQWVKKMADSWMIELSELKQEKQSIQTFFLMAFFQKTLVPKGIAVHQMHIQQMLTMINQSAPQVSMDLEKDWQFVTEYNKAYLKKRHCRLEEQIIQLTLGNSVFLSESEWLGLETSEEKIERPASVADWSEQSLEISRKTPLPLTIRYRKNGDRIPLTEGLTKRLNRIFIDRKTPNQNREQARVILSAEGDIIWVPGFVNSYLSIPKETDKIHYRLLYKIKE